MDELEELLGSFDELALDSVIRGVGNIAKRAKAKSEDESVSEEERKKHRKVYLEYRKKEKLLREIKRGNATLDDYRALCAELDNKK